MRENNDICTLFVVFRFNFNEQTTGHAILCFIKHLLQAKEIDSSLVDCEYRTLTINYDRFKILHNNFQFLLRYFLSTWEYRDEVARSLKYPEKKT